jgi:hypothetical protein
MATMHLRSAMILAAMVSACGPQDGVNDVTDASSGSTATTADTPTSTTAADTAAATTAGETVDPTTAVETVEPTTEAPPAVGCEKVVGGAVDWAMLCGGASWESVQGFGLDGASNLLLALDVRALDPLPPFMIGDFEIVPGEASDLVLVKFSSEGDALWVRHFSGPGNQYASAMAVCGDGMVIAGSAPPGFDLGGGPLNDDTFIAGFDGDGNHLWSRGLKVLDDMGHIIVSDIACDATGTFALTGQIRGAVDFGAGPLTPAELYDGYLAQFAADGALAWNVKFGAIGYSPFGRSVAFAPNGDVAVVGSFGDAVDLGQGPLVADGGDDALVARFDAAGTHLWSLQIGPDNLQYGDAVAVDAAGQVAVGGAFLLDIEIGADSYTNVFPNANEEEWGTLYDGFVAVLDPAGAPQWSDQIGTMLNEEVAGLQFDAGGRLVFYGLTDERHTVRIYEAMTPGFEWATDQVQFREVGLAGEDALYVAGVAYDGVDFGAGALAPRGDTDLVIVRVPR